jgi:AcrR family transcriptional regulator
VKHDGILSTTQISILNAACKIITDRGAEALTIEAVAREAGISKGGLLYHFPSKNKLIEGMIKRMVDDMESSLDQEMAKNGDDFLAAFIHVTINNDCGQNRLSTALSAVIANDPELLQPLQIRYLEWQKRAEASAPSPEIGALVRLAMDGLWIADLFDLAPPSPEMRKKISDVLFSIIHRTG